jgi:hypothetical protein
LTQNFTYFFSGWCTTDGEDGKLGKGESCADDTGVDGSAVSDVEGAFGERLELIDRLAALFLPPLMGDILEEAGSKSVVNGLPTRCPIEQSSSSALPKSPPDIFTNTRLLISLIELPTSCSNSWAYLT